MSRHVQLFYTQTRQFGRISRRKPRTGKHCGRWFYKGRGCISLGSKNTKGQFRFGINRFGAQEKVDRILDLNIPNLDGFQLKPYVARKDAN